MSVLDHIIDGVKEDLAARRSAYPLAAVERLVAQAPPVRDAYPSLVSREFALITEVKRSSPSKGQLASITDPAGLAAQYAAGGAAAVSVLTEERRFGGSLADLDAVRAAVDVPVLRKDFMVDEYQFYEARAHGADMVLLIVAALDDAQLRDFGDLAAELGMAALVETHTAEEIERARAVNARILGVNVRNLKTLDVDRQVFADLAPALESVGEGTVIVAESGVSGVHDIEFYARHGARAALVGEALVKNSDPRGATEEFTAAGALVRAAQAEVAPAAKTGKSSA